MDSLQFSPTDYNDDKAPRTPSPPTSAPAQHGQNYKQDMDNSVHIFNPDHDANDAYQWGQSPASNAVAPVPRPSLLQELYDSDGLSPEHSSPPDMYVDNNDWSPNPPPAPAPHMSPHQRPADYTLIRRATLPYARQERPEGLGGYPPFLPPHAAHHHGHPHAHEAPMYANEMPLSAEPAALHGDTYSPPGYGGEFDHDAGVKLEDGHHLHHYPPPGAGFYRGVPQHPHMHPHLHPAHHPHMAPHHGMHGYAPHGIAVQHTDDAASKETQYLRRRCFNCHTTEPPSWRRSTLNPGKIVCNKCGLYERTHLRPRPLRFDELRAGNKARKGAAAAAAAAKGSPKAQVTNGVKKAPGLVRRSSVSSTGSSAQSGSGASDWDDSVSVYSSTSASTPGSGPPTSFSSPHPPSLSLSSSVTGSPGSRRDSLSRSPPLLGSPPHSAGLPSTSSGMGIRLPNAPEIPALNGHGLGAGLRTKPRSNTTGGVGMGMYYSPPPSAHHPALHHSSSNSSLHSAHGDAGAPLHASPSMLHAEVGGDLYRRGSLPDMHAAAGASNGWDDGMGMGMGGMGGLGLGMGVNVKEEPRAVLV